MSGTIIILALVAAFLGLRLYSVLGKRTGHEQEPVLPRSDDRPPVLIPAGDRDVARTQSAPSPQLVYEPSAERGISALLASDRSFDVSRFLQGAQAAYRQILEAYWAGDRDTLRRLCDADSYEAFDGAITAREQKGEQLANRLIRIDDARIVDADLIGKDATVTVRFEADIAAITRDNAGAIIAGSMTDALSTTDVWSFRRVIDSADPNWLLDETDAG